MRVITARNVNDAYYAGTQLLAMHGTRVDSRNGPVLRISEPVTTVYQRPTERVLFDERRNANPFFHFFEAMWMLNGQNDVKTMDQFLGSFKRFSDDGETYHGAYGHRWRHWPKPTTTYTEEIDQLAEIIAMLKTYPEDRRAVVGMWDPARDLNRKSNDIPCNDLIKFSIRDGRLQMTVFCRSNDVIYGAYGANAVHMSILMEYMAGMIGVEVGEYSQISDDFHGYLKTPYNFEDFYPPIVHLDNPYEHAAERSVQSFPLVAEAEWFDTELASMMSGIHDEDFEEMELHDFANPFFVAIAQPMYAAFKQYKADDIPGALTTLRDAALRHPYDPDWLLAADMWLQRIADARAEKANPIVESDVVDPNPDGEQAPKHTHRFAPQPYANPLANKSEPQPTQHGTVNT